MSRFCCANEDQQSLCVCVGLGRAARWKTRIQQNAAALFSRRSADMQSLVYGTSAADTSRGKHAQQVTTAYLVSSTAVRPCHSQDFAHVSHISNHSSQFECMCLVSPTAMQCCGSQDFAHAPCISNHS